MIFRTQIDNQILNSVSIKVGDSSRWFNVFRKAGLHRPHSPTQAYKGYTDLSRAR